jgi:hypothetical protein
MKNNVIQQKEKAIYFNLFEDFVDDKIISQTSVKLTDFMDYVFKDRQKTLSVNCMANSFKMIAYGISDHIFGDEQFYALNNFNIQYDGYGKDYSDYTIIFHGDEKYIDFNVALKQIEGEKSD